MFEQQYLLFPFHLPTGVAVYCNDDLDPRRLRSGEGKYYLWAGNLNVDFVLKGLHAVVYHLTSSTSYALKREKIGSLVFLMQH
jgi:hypothetical protein